MPNVHKQLINQHLKILKGLQYDSGLFAASNKNVDTGYDKSWLRDNFYECLAFEVLKDWDTARKTYKALLRIFIRHEAKITAAINAKPQYRHEYIHARFHPETFDEFWEEWGNKQNDAIGAILFGIANIELDQTNNVKLLETEDELRITQKLVDYLISIQFWHDKDSGMWEEDEEVHASSVGACVAGLRAIAKVPNITVDQQVIENGLQTLSKLLPRESEKKFIDLALLSLVWPYNVVTDKQRDDILKNAEYHLVRNKGLIRYKNDYYYNKNADGYSEEAEWTFGFSWLAIIYKQLGNEHRATHYEKLAIKTENKQGEIPELYYSNTNVHNENSPLGWSESMFIIALHELNRKHFDKLQANKIYAK